MTYEIRQAQPDDYVAFRRVGDAAFGWQPSDEDVEADRPFFEPERSLAAYDEGRIVGTAATVPFELTLPGLTTVPVSGVTAVGVLPTHRRRGILRAMMRRQLDDVRARGESLAILTASESVIYDRFGYGLATSEMGIDIDTRHAAFARPFEPSGHFTLLDHETESRALPALYDRVRRRRPGAVSRSEVRWRHTLRNPGAPMDGASGRFTVAYEAPSGEIDGVAVYRVRGQWVDGIASNTLLLREIFAATPEAYAAVWRYILSVDLVTNVQGFKRPVDEPLRWLLADPRRLRVTRLSDDLWVRIVDIPAALAARRYSAADGLVLAVSDSFLPDNTGCYALEGGPDGATCRLTSASPDLTLSAADLGAILLGGVRPSTLAQAQRVTEETAGALRRADALFAGDTAPYCGTPF